MVAGPMIWQMLAECVGQLDEPFRRSEVVGWFRRHYPQVNESSLAAHLQSATSNAPASSKNAGLGGRTPLVTRIDHGLYVRYAGPPRQPTRDARPTSPLAPADVVLVGCTATRAPEPAPARDLFRGERFRKARAYAERSGRRWYVLSARWGLLDPEEVIAPYDVHLAAQPHGYQRAWGSWVTARLAIAEGSLTGRVVEVHASAAYCEPLREPLRAAGVVVQEPLAGLRRGEQLAWYTAAQGQRPAQVEPRHSDAGGPEFAALVAALRAESQARSPEELLEGGRAELNVPGLYTWWVDHEGADDLSRGLRHHVSAGLIYAGQAGATRWPSGQRSSNTLWGRLAGMHLGKRAEFSTFRRTLAAALRSALGLHAEDDPRLDTWIRAHLRVNAVPVPDPDRLGRIEADVLRLLDPPLNLAGMPPTPLRAQLAAQRANRSRHQDDDNETRT